MVGNAPLLNRALEIAVKVAPTDMGVLVLGESGVGKENFSKVIHSLSRRKHNGFIAINCGAIPAGTIDSELFGHEKGSFTSAVETRKGYFETVDGGTIFLDEIGEMPLETQSRLLRVLESGEFLKVGSSKVQKTDVRVIAATNKDLFDQAQKGKFREDLYYRLSTVTIKIPPLRERPEDIPFLFAKFASDISDKYRVPPLELTPDALHRIQTFPWPGNIRQLKNFVEQLSILETERLLNRETVEKYLPEVPVTSLTTTALSESFNTASGFHEREILYKFLIDIKQDVSDLRKSVYELMKVLNANAQATSGQPITVNTKLLAPMSAEPVAPPVYPATGYSHTEDHDSVYLMPEETRDEPVSLHQKEKELIKKSLLRHHGKRKTAASELGISERTLYRKIKEYNLEDM